VSYKLTDNLWKVAPDIDITPTDMLVLQYLSWRANDKGFCWPATSTIARDTKLGRTGVTNALNRLREQGLIQVTKHKYHGRLTNKYQIAHALLEGMTCPSGKHDMPSEKAGHDLQEGINISENKSENRSENIAGSPRTIEEEDMRGKNLDEIMSEGKQKAEELKTIDPKEYANQCLNTQGTLTGEGMAKLWGFMMYRAGFVSMIPQLSMKDKKQLKDLKTKYLAGSDQAAAQVLITCLENWKLFTKRVQSENQLPNHPTVPQIWYVLKNAEIAMAFVVEQGIASTSGDMAEEVQQAQKDSGKFWFLDSEGGEH